MESTFHGTALEDIEECQCRSSDVDNDQRGNGCPLEDPLVLGEGQVEETDGGLGSHQGRVLCPSAGANFCLLYCGNLHIERKRHIPTFSDQFDRRSSKIPGVGLNPTLFRNKWRRRNRKR